jgi:hypothetical protein
VKNQELSKVDDYEIIERTNEQIHDHEVDGYKKMNKIGYLHGLSTKHGYIGL